MSKGAAQAARCRRLISVAAVVLMAVVLSGCAAQPLSGLLRSDEQPQGPNTVTPPVAFAPIIGAPANVAQKMSGQVEGAARAQNITVVSAKEDKPTYTVRGYFAASPEGSSAKIAYLWDVTDSGGKRVHRISGEALAPSKPGGNPWAGIDDAAMQKIATATAADLAAWLPKEAAPRPVAARAGEGPVAAAAGRAAPGQVLTYVPAVSGAPGDGQQSLTLAIKKQLFNNGIKLASTPDTATHTVRGVVSLTRPEGGKQTISIEWQVIDTQGRRLGTVSQKNTIAQGALDKSWGPVADAAAGAAADGIIKLLPKPQT